MRAIEKTFQNLKKHNEGALLAYVTAGDPRPECTPIVVEALVKGGADIIELGIPFSDPIADGPTIQAAMVRALKAGTTPRMTLEVVRKIKEKHNVPIVLLTYFNPIYRMGVENFFSLAKKSHVDGVITPDLPVEEASEYKKVSEAYEIDTIFLATPSTSIGRLQEIIKYTSGFLYLVSVFGVTGTRENVQDLTIKQIKRFLPYTKDRISLAVGFGISKPEHVKAIINSGAEGAIVGSAFVNIIQRNRGNIQRMIQKVEHYTRSLKDATKRAHINS